MPRVEFESPKHREAFYLWKTAKIDGKRNVHYGAIFNDNDSPEFHVFEIDGETLAQHYPKNGESDFVTVSENHEKEIKAVTDFFVKCSPQEQTDLYRYPGRIMERIEGYRPIDQPNFITDERM